MSLHHRSASLTATEGRTLFGTIVPFGQVARVTDDGRRHYDETFVPGSFTRTIRERGDKVRLYGQHNRSTLPLGAARLLEERGDGVYGEFTVARTSAGDDLLALVEDGVVTSFSVGFVGIRDRRDGDVVVRTEVSLREVSAVAEPAYSGAAIAGVRSAEPTVPLSVVRKRLEVARASAAPFLRP